MATFFTDADLAGAGEFVEATVTLATEYDLPDGSIARFRVPFPALAGSLPVIRLYNAGGTLVTSVAFDTTATSAWNWATPGSPIAITAGTYRAAVVVTRYSARSAFFTAPITRGDITGVRGRFASGDVAPGGTSTASYFVDVDFTASGGEDPGQGSAGPGLDLAVAAAGRRDSRGAVATAASLVLAASGRRQPVGSGALALALDLAASGRRAPVGEAALGLALAVDAHGRRPSRGSADLELAVAAAVSGRGERQVIQRPNTGVITRPNTGIIARP